MNTAQNNVTQHAMHHHTEQTDWAKLLTIAKHITGIKPGGGSREGG